MSLIISTILSSLYLFLYSLACGIEYCYECENGVCVHCVLGAVEFEHECYVGERALIAIVAREQEAEVEAEEREKDDAGLACK